MIWRPLRSWWGRPNPDPNLGFVGDGDEIDVVQAIERQFGARFAKADLESMRTIGDLFELLCKALPDLDRDVTWREYTHLLYEYGAVCRPDEMKPSMMFLSRLYD